MTSSLLSTLALPFLALGTRAQEGVFEADGVEVHYVTALLGYSSGAFIAGKVAALHPVLSLIFAGQAPLVTGTPMSFSEVELFTRLVAEGGDLADYVLATMPADRPRPTLEQAQAFADFLFAGKDVEGIALAGQSFPRLEATREELALCTAPMLFVHGGKESEHVQGRVASVRAALGRGELVVLEGGDHMTTLIQPEFSPTVLAFARAAGAKPRSDG